MLSGAQLANVCVKVAEEERGGGVDFGALWVGEIYRSRAMVRDGVATARRRRGGEVRLADLAQVGKEGRDVGVPREDQQA